MTRAGFVGVLALVVLAVAWSFGRLDAPDVDAPRVARSPAPRRSAVPPPPSPAAATDLAVDDGVPGRDLFVYADDEPAQPAVIVLETPPAAPAVPTPEPPHVRLVGFVGRAKQLRAALAAHGQVVVAGVGDAVGDARVLAIDEDRGVHVRLADGREIWLRPAR